MLRLTGSPAPRGGTRGEGMGGTHAAVPLLPAMGRGARGWGEHMPRFPCSPWWDAGLGDGGLTRHCMQRLYQQPHH